MISFSAMAPSSRVLITPLPSIANSHGSLGRPHASTVGRLRGAAVRRVDLDVDHRHLVAVRRHEVEQLVEHRTAVLRLAQRGRGEHRDDGLAGADHVGERDVVQRARGHPGADRVDAHRVRRAWVTARVAPAHRRSVPRRPASPGSRTAPSCRRRSRPPCSSRRPGTRCRRRRCRGPSAVRPCRGSCRGRRPGATPGGANATCAGPNDANFAPRAIANTNRCGSRRRVEIGRQAPAVRSPCSSLPSSAPAGPAAAAASATPADPARNPRREISREKGPESMPPILPGRGRNWSSVSLPVRRQPPSTSSANRANRSSTCCASGSGSCR